MTTEIFGAVSYERMEEQQSSLPSPTDTQPPTPISQPTQPSSTTVAPPAPPPLVVNGQLHGPQALVVQPNQPIILSYNKPKRPKIRTNYKGKMSKVLGIIQIVGGIVVIVCQITGYYLQIVKRKKYYNDDDADSYYTWHGAWCGIFLIVGGTFAYVSGKYKHIGLIISTMVVCIFTALFSMVTIGLAAWGVEHDKGTAPYIARFTTPPNVEYILKKQDEYSQGSLAVGVFMIVSGAAALVASIITSTLCCAVACCCADNPDEAGGQVLYLNPGSVSGAGTIQIPQSGSVAPTYYIQQGNSLQTDQATNHLPPYNSNPPSNDGAAGDIHKPPDPTSQ